MGSPILDQLVIPTDWPQAVRTFWDLEANDSLSCSHWETIVDWLMTTDFDDRSYLAGEAAAVLIRDRAPAEIRERLWSLSGKATGWTLHCCIVAFQEDCSLRFRDLLERAVQSPHEITRRAGKALLADRFSVTRA